MSHKLMIPGPVTVEDDVLLQLSSPVQAHYGPQWAAIYHETTGLLKQVFKTKGDIHILAGSGSAGLDAAIGSITAPGETIVVGVNGYFGQRLAIMGQCYGLNVITVEAPYGQPLNPADFDSALTQHADAALVALVHLETSTTVLNPVEAIAAVVRQHGVPLMVDAVSSLGGVPLDMDGWGIDLCGTASQKCLGAIAGLAPVAVSARAWDIMASKPQRNHGWYLNLQIWQEHATHWGDWHPYPITMPTNSILALRAGLLSLLAEGLENRIQRYSRLAKQLRDGIQSLGLRLFASEDYLSPVLTGVMSPDGIPSSRLVSYLLNECGIKITGGFGDEMKERIFRVGHMGPTLTEADMDLLLGGISAFLRTLPSQG